MELITEPEDIPDEQYHTLSVEKTNDNDFCVTAKNNETIARVFVESVALDGEAAGVLNGEFTLDAADSWFKLEYVDFNEEFGYGEVQVRFEDRY